MTIQAQSRKQRVSDAGLDKTVRDVETVSVLFLTGCDGSKGAAAIIRYIRPLLSRDPAGRDTTPQSQISTRLEQLHSHFNYQLGITCITDLFPES